MALSPDLLSASSHLLCTEDGADVASCNDSRSIAAAADNVWFPACHVTSAALVDTCGLASLLAAEADHMPLADSVDAASRHDAVKWILKVSEFYRFRAVTTYLAVNYLDRFLSLHSLPASCDLGNKQGNGGGGGWPMQLLSVACVSVSAKMEEVCVPAMLDLQILGAGYVFDPRTVRRMELLLMAALGWRMRAVTPFDFLPFFAASAPLLSRAADLVLLTLRVMDFIRYRPSAIAAAAALCAADEVAAAGDDLLRLSDQCVKEEVVSECRQLMEDYLIDACPSAPQSKTKPPCTTHDPPLPPPPRSPVAVLDSAAACGSCNSAVQASSSTAADGRASHRLSEPSPKRRRIRMSRCTESFGCRLRGKPL